jgi:hypothetical protein
LTSEKTGGQLPPEDQQEEQLMGRPLKFSTRKRRKKKKKEATATRAIRLKGGRTLL